MDTPEIAYLQASESDVVRFSRQLFQPVFDLEKGEIAAIRLMSPAEADLPRLTEVERCRAFLNLLYLTLQLWRLPSSHAFNHYPLVVKLEGALLKVPGLDQQIRTIIRLSGFNPRLLVLLIPESSIHDAFHLPDQLAALQGLGIRFSIDDYLARDLAALSFMASSGIHFLHLPKSVVHALSTNLVSRSYVRGMLALAGQLDKNIVLEGADNLDLLQLARSVGARYVQGDSIERPVSSWQLASCCNRIRVTHHAGGWIAE